MSDDDESVGYGNTHRAFLQAFLARQATTYEEAKPILAAIQTAATPDRPTQPEDVSQADFENYIHALNDQLSPFDLEIRSTRHQTSKELIYALVNTTSDALTQLATTHSADEIAFVKRVLDVMFDSNNTPGAEIMAVTSMQALKCAKPPNEASRRTLGNTQSQASQSSLTMAQAEKVLANLVSEGWFELSSRGFYTLTPRALMELRDWLIDTYNDQASGSEEEEDPHDKIKFCQACKEIVTVGQRCPNLVCQARLHSGCVRNMFRAQGNNEECPICKTAWVDVPPVGEKAAKASKGGRGRSSAANPGVGSGRRRSSGMGMDGANDDSDASDGAVE